MSTNPDKVKDEFLFWQLFSPQNNIEKIYLAVWIVLGDQCDKESHGDYESFSSTIPCVYVYIEKQFWAYTNAKFWEV